MAAPATALLQGAYDSTKNFIAGESRAFKEDPIDYIGDRSLKGGFFCLVGSLAAYLAGTYAQRAETYFEQDADARLGIAPQTPPNAPPPAVPVPTVYQTAFADLVSQLANLSVTSAPDAATALWQAASDAQTIQAYLQQNAGPSTSQSDAANLFNDLFSAVTSMGYVPSALFSYAQTQWLSAIAAINSINAVLPDLTPADPLFLVLTEELAVATTLEAKWGQVQKAYHEQQGGAGYVADWTAAQTDVTAAMKDANLMAVDLAGQPPFVIVAATSPPAPSPPAPSLWQQVLAVVSSVPGAASSWTASIWPNLEAIPGIVGGWAATAVSDAEALVGDVEAALKLLGTALLNLPFLIVDGVGYGVTLFVSTIGTDLYAPLLYAGLLFLAVAFFCKVVWPKLKGRLFVKADAWVDRVLGLDAQEKQDFKADISAVQEEQALEAAAQAVMAPIADVQAVPAAPAASPEPASAPQVVPEAPVVQPVVPEPAIAVPPLQPTPTEEVEAQLGEPDTVEPTAEEIRQMEVIRVESYPHRKKGPSGTEMMASAQSDFAAMMSA